MLVALSGSLSRCREACRAVDETTFVKQEAKLSVTSGSNLKSRAILVGQETSFGSRKERRWKIQDISVTQITRLGDQEAYEARREV